MNEQMQIKIEFSEDGLFGGWTDMEWYDIEASKIAYRDAVRLELTAEYPGAEIEVVTGLDMVNNRVTVNGERDTYEAAFVGEVVSDVYQSFAWVRYTESGIREAVKDAGVWIQREDGVIVSVGNVDTDAGPAYEISFHKGENIEFSSFIYPTIWQTLAAMRMSSNADWSEWHPRTE